MGIDLADVTGMRLDRKLLAVVLKTINIVIKLEAARRCKAIADEPCPCLLYTSDAADE